MTDDADKESDLQATSSSVREFARWKNTALSKIDMSRKGSIDEEIHDLVNFINSQADYFTTSSCSGRILLCSDDFSISHDVDSDSKPNVKKGCHWFFVSHKIFDIDALTRALDDVNCASKFKFEPFVLHAQCRTLEAARLLHRTAVGSGFRNSGITFGKGGEKIIAAVRGTSCLEVPLTDDEGGGITPIEYVRHIAQISHKKLTANFVMIGNFYKDLCKALENCSVSLKNHTGPRGVYRRKGRVPRSKTNADCGEFSEPITLFNEDST